MTVLQKPHTQVWGTLRRYLTYTTAGIAVMGGVGAFEAHRPSSIPAADAAALAREFSGTEAIASGFASSGSLGLDASLPLWAQRIANGGSDYTLASATTTEEKPADPITATDTNPADSQTKSTTEEKPAQPQ